MSYTSRGSGGNRGDLIPGVVKQLLAPGEEVEARYEMMGSEAYATGRRLIILRSGKTTNLNYDRIATMREFSRTNIWLMLGGVALFALGGTSPVFPVAGASLILFSVLARSRRVEIFVTGLKEPVVLDGAREVLVPLVQKLAEKRGKLPL